MVLVGEAEEVGAEEVGAEEEGRESGGRGGAEAEGVMGGGVLVAGLLVGFPVGALAGAVAVERGVALRAAGEGAGERGVGGLAGVAGARGGGGRVGGGSWGVESVLAIAGGRGETRWRLTHGCFLLLCRWCCGCLLRCPRRLA